MKLIHRYLVCLLAIINSQAGFADTPKVQRVIFNDAHLKDLKAKTLYVRDDHKPCTGKEITKAELHLLLNLGEDYNYGKNTFSTVVKIHVRGFTANADGTRGTLQFDFKRELEIDNTKPEQLYVHDFTTIHSAVDIIDITVAGYGRSDVVRNDIRLEASYTEEFKNYVSPAASLVTISAIAMPDNPQRFSWFGSCPDIPNYQFQLLRLFNENPGALSERDITARIDWSKALSIETGTPDTSIVLTLAEGTGYYIWRVRAIGNYYPGGITHEWNLGSWTYAPSDGASITFTEGSSLPEYVFFYRQFDSDKNWIFTRKFSGDSKFSEGIVYANGLQHSRQQQQRLQSIDSTWVEQTLYDYSGRVAGKSMVAPVSARALGYVHGFMQHGTALYTARHFDEHGRDPQPVTAGPLGTYYSNSNADLRIPDAGGYPFSRVLYYGDGTKRPKELGERGAAHRIQPDINSSHTSKLYYSSVADNELIKMFGDEAPADTSVFKIITMDPNKTVNVTYVASSGDTLATCLAASNNNALDPLAARTGSITSLSDTLSANVSCGENCWEAQKQLVFIQPTSLTLTYSIHPGEISESCQQICRTCDYKVYFIINRLDEQDTSFPKKDSLLVPGTACPAMPGTWTMTHLLEPGSYRITKRIMADILDPSSVSISNPLGSTYRDEQKRILRDSLQVQLSRTTSPIRSYLQNSDLHGLYRSLGVSEKTTSGNVTIIPAGCCDITLPVIKCPENRCPADLSFERYFTETINDPALTGVNWIGALKYLPRFRPGEFDAMIRNMINDPVHPYNCDSLWMCWQILTASYKDMHAAAGVFHPRLSGFHYNNNLLDQFLSCAGRRLRGITRRRIGDYEHPGFTSHAYSYIYFNSSGTYIEEACIRELTGGNVVVDTTRTYETADLMRFYRCISSANSSYEPIVAGFTADSVKRECENTCEARRAGFILAIKREYVTEGYEFVKGMGYVNPGKEIVTQEDIYCKAQMLVEHCKTGCNLTTFRNPHDPLRIDSIGTRQEITRLREAMTYSYEIALSKTGGCPPGFKYVDGGHVRFTFDLAALQARINRFMSTLIGEGYFPADSLYGPDLLNALRFCSSPPIYLKKGQIVTVIIDQECQLVLIIREGELSTHIVICDNICVSKADCGGLCFRWKTITIDSAYTFKPRTCDNITAEHLLSLLDRQETECIEAKLQVYEESYRNQCLRSGSIRDVFSLHYNLGYYHYTLFYFDRARNLVRTVPPKGVDLSSVSRLQHPNHMYVTEYTYNSLRQRIAQKTPDNGVVTYHYSNSGLLRFTQNDKQRDEAYYSYKIYDYQKRVIEIGESRQQAGTFPVNANNFSFPDAPSDKRETNQIVYSMQYGLNKPQRFLTNRVSAMQNHEGAVTYYSYDPLGNIEWMVQEVPGLGTKYIAYEYDEVLGVSTKIKYNEGKDDQYYHRFSYDADKRLRTVETSMDGRLWDKDARYQYYGNGSLSRVVIGEDKVQGQDFLYTIHGWLKAINHPALSMQKDPGHDGLENTVARDAFAMSLGYYNGDFNRIGSPFSTTDSSYLNIAHPLYDGNIAGLSSHIQPHLGSTLYYKNLTGERFRYDETGQLKATYFNHYNSSWQSVSDYATQYTYDPNGNIRSLVRNGFTAHHLSMDNLTYHYDTLTNRLNHITDAIDESYYTEDLDNQATGNYAYDAIGNLTRDEREGIKNIKWTSDGKVKEILRITGDQLHFTYNALGHRVSKTFYPSSAEYVITTYYILNHEGNIISTYVRTKTEKENDITHELLIYGKDRLGICTPTEASRKTTSNYYTRHLSLKNYELNDHLGNVRTLITDVKLSQLDKTGVPGKFKADLQASYNYYAFGSTMPGRFYHSLNYRFGYNGMEKDDELKGLGNSYTTEFRQYDSRVGRWLSVDPKIVPWQSAYTSFGNNPVRYTDVRGDTIRFSYMLGGGFGLSYAYTAATTTVNDWRQFTGLDISYNGIGTVMINRDRRGNPILLRDASGRIIGDAVARQRMLRMIEHRQVVRINFTDVLTSSSVTIWDRHSALISIPEVDNTVRELAAAGINPTTMGYGMFAWHELGHTVLGGGHSGHASPLNDTRVPNLVGSNETRLNEVRRRLGLPPRSRYLTPIGGTTADLFR
jgi:RHS repeat-associated protein